MVFPPRWLTCLTIVLLQIIPQSLTRLPAQAETIAQVPIQPSAADWSALLDQASEHESQHRYAEAEALYRQILSQPRPTSMNDYMYFYIQVELGRNLESQGKLAAAIEIWQAVVDTAGVDPDNLSRAQRNIEAVRDKLQKSEANITTGLQKIQADPNSPWGYQILANGLAAQGQLEQGFIFLKQQLGYTLAPNQAIELARAAQDGSVTDFPDGYQKYAVAIVLYRQLVQRYPNYQPARSELLDILNLWGQPEDAIAAYREAIQRDPSLITIYWRPLTHQLETAGRWDEAKQIYDQLIQQQAAGSDVYLDLGHLFEQTQQLDRALQVYVQVIQIFPRHHPSDRRCHVVKETGYDRLVKLLARQNRLDQVLITLEQAQPNPTADMYNGLGLALEYQGHADQAEIVYRRFHERYPDARLKKGGCGSDYQEFNF